MNKKLISGLAMAAFSAAIISAASAADLPVTKNAGEPERADFDIAFAVTLTSDYISRGLTQSDHDPAIQGSIEASYGIVYGGIWASSVSFGGARGAEIDFYAGVRPEIGKLKLDFGYNLATFTNNVEVDTGELYAKAEIDPVDKLTLGAQFFINPENSETYTEANFTFELPSNFSVSGAVGYVKNDTPYVTWNAGIAWNWDDWATLDLRYHDTNLSAADCGIDCSGRIVASLTLNTSLSRLARKPGH